MVTTPDEEPSDAMSRLRRRIYGPDADAAAVAEYEQLVEARGREQDAAAQAVGAASTRSAGLGSAAAILRPTRAFVVLLAVLLVAGIAAGGLAQWRAAGRPATGRLLALPASAKSAEATLAIFDRKQVPADIPAGQFGATLVRGTARLLTRESITGTSVFAIRDADGDVCLLASRSVTTAACASPAEFGTAGLELHWTEVVAQVNPTGLVQVDAVWMPGGDVRVQAQL